MRNLACKFAQSSLVRLRLSCSSFFLARVARSDCSSEVTLHHCIEQTYGNLSTEYVTRTKIVSLLLSRHGHVADPSGHKSSVFLCMYNSTTLWRCRFVKHELRSETSQKRGYVEDSSGERSRRRPSRFRHKRIAKPSSMNICNVHIQKDF